MYITIKIINKLTLSEEIHTYIADDLKKLIISILEDFDKIYDYELIECGTME